MLSSRSQLMVTPIFFQDKCHSEMVCQGQTLHSNYDPPWKSAIQINTFKPIGIAPICIVGKYHVKRRPILLPLFHSPVINEHVIRPFTHSLIVVCTLTTHKTCDTAKGEATRRSNGSVVENMLCMHKVPDSVQAISS